MIELSRSRKANVLALVAIVGIFGGLLPVWQGNETVSGAASVSALASGNAAVYFVSGGALYATDAGGTLRQRIPLAALGLGRGVSHLAVLDDALLVADGGRGVVRRCDLARRACTELARIPMPRRGGTLALAAAPEAGRFYVADSASHHLHAHAPDGKRLYRLDIDGGLKYPNEVLWLGEGRLLVVDTNHHRILVVKDEKAGRTTLLQETKVKNDLGRGNAWPTAAARDRRGNTWVINSDGMLKRGELIVYDASGTARRRIDLGEGADPIVLASLGDTVLLGDFDNHRLQRVDSNGRVEPFGDAAVAAALQGLRAQHRDGLRLRNLGIGMMGLFGLLAAFAGYFDWQIRRALAPAQPQPYQGQAVFDEPRHAVLDAAARLALRPDAHGVVWLAASRKTLRRLSLVLALSLLMMGGATFMLWQTFESMPTRLLALIGVFPIVLLSVGAWLIRGTQRLRVGTDGKLLHIVDMFGRQGRGFPEAFLHTGRRLVLGRIAVPVPNPRMALFDREAFAAVIEPMLADTPRGSEWALLLRNLRQGDPLAWAGVLAIVAAIALRVWLDL